MKTHRMEEENMRERNFDMECIEGVRDGDENAFKRMFLKYYPSLCSVAADYVDSYDIGKEIAHEVLLNIWERGKDWQPEGPLRPYLYHAVCKKSINYIKQDQSRRNAMIRYRVNSNEQEFAFNDESERDELIQLIWKAVKKLPKQRYMIFVLHKRRGFSYKEIARAMEISIKTVENQMGRALKFLREELEANSISKKL